VREADLRYCSWNYRSSCTGRRDYNCSYVPVPADATAKVPMVPVPANALKKVHEQPRVVHQEANSSPVRVKLQAGATAHVTEDSCVRADLQLGIRK
jgi:hypothetical protein